MDICGNHDIIIVFGRVFYLPKLDPVNLWPEKPEKIDSYHRFIPPICCYPVQEKVFKKIYQKKIRKNNRRLKCNFDYREKKI